MQKCILGHLVQMHFPLLSVSAWRGIHSRSCFLSILGRECCIMRQTDRKLHVSVCFAAEMWKMVQRAMLLMSQDVSSQKQSDKERLLPLTLSDKTSSRGCFILRQFHLGQWHSLMKTMIQSTGSVKKQKLFFKIPSDLSLKITQTPPCCPSVHFGTY